MAMRHTEAAAQQRKQLRELRGRARSLHENRRILTNQIGWCVVQSKPTTRLHVERRQIDDELEGTYAAINILESQIRTLTNRGADEPEV